MEPFWVLNEKWVLEKRFELSGFLKTFELTKKASLFEMMCACLDFIVSYYSAAHV